MSQSLGYWILLEAHPGQYTSTGLPQIGDPVKLDYDENFTALAGTAKLIGSSSIDAKSSYKSPENGASFVFSANFGNIL